MFRRIAQSAWKRTNTFQKRTNKIVEVGKKDNAVASMESIAADTPTSSTILSMTAGALFASLGYYLLHEEIWQSSMGLAKSVSGLTEIKTKQQLDKEAAELKQKEHEALLEKRRNADSIPEKEPSFEEAVVLKVKRYWNDAFMRLGEELAKSEANRLEREKEKIKENVLREMEAKGVPRERVQITLILEEK